MNIPKIRVGKKLLILFVVISKDKTFQKKSSTKYNL